MHFDINSAEILSGDRFLGNICKRNHDWRETGKSIRLIGNNGCVHCREEKAWRKKCGLPPLPSTALKKNPDPTVDANSLPMTDKRYLGKLCPRGHEWNGTGQSLRAKVDRNCVACTQERTKRLRRDLPKLEKAIIEYKNLEEALWSRVAKTGEDDCWEWQAGASHGYGIFRFGGKRYYAHTASYELFHGEIPKGDVSSGEHLYILHSCDNPLCCNPKHLSAGTHKQNISEMYERGRHCKGVDRASNKLLEEQVIELRRCYNAGEATQAQLAEKYGVSGTTVWHIIHKTKWKHI